MASQVFPFDNESNYTLSDSDKLQITLGEAILKLVNDPDNDFNEDFADDTGHIYESDKGEFLGGQFQQTDQKGGALFGANYSVDQNANWSIGSGTGTLFGGATVTGGKLDLSGGVLAYVLYNPTDNLGINQGAVKFKLTPKYSGSPSSYQYIISTEASVGIAGEITLIHTSTGNLAVTIRDNTGNLIFSTAGFGAWSPTADQEYELELNFYFDPGGSEIRLFVDGNQLGSTLTTGMTSITRGRFYVGCEWSESTTIDIIVDDLMLFDTVQHTSNYTPGYTVSNTIYVETYDLLPEMHYTGAGTLIQATDFQTSFSGSPRIAIDIGQSGEYTYWNGSAWVTGGDDYDHATSPADFLTNIATLPVVGETYGQFIIYYPDSNTQSAFSDLTITLTSQIYPTDNPYLDINSRWYIDELETITAVKTVTGSDQVKLALKKGTQFYYISGGVLTESDGTYSQSNTVEEWETYKALFTSIKTYIGIRVFLHSEDGLTSPAIDTLTVQYSYAGDTPDTVDKCIVWGTFIDEVGDPMIGPIQVVLTNLVAQYKTGTMIRRKSPAQEMELDSTGYGEIELVETENMTGSQTYTFQFDNNVIRKRQVPNQATANFFDLTE